MRKEKEGGQSDKLRCGKRTLAQEFEGSRIAVWCLRLPSDLLELPQLATSRVQRRRDMKVTWKQARKMRRPRYVEFTQNYNQKGPAGDVLRSKSPTSRTSSNPKDTILDLVHLILQYDFHIRSGQHVIFISTRNEGL